VFRAPARYVLDTDCCIDADHDPTLKAAFSCLASA
jgi:hypothetical protein